MSFLVVAAIAVIFMLYVVSAIRSSWRMSRLSDQVYTLVGRQLDETLNKAAQDESTAPRTVQCGHCGGRVPAGPLCPNCGAGLP